MTEPSGPDELPACTYPGCGRSARDGHDIVRNAIREQPGSDRCLPHLPRTLARQDRDVIAFASPGRVNMDPGLVDLLDAVEFGLYAFLVMERERGATMDEIVSSVQPQAAYAAAVALLNLERRGMVEKTAPEGLGGRVRYRAVTRVPEIARQLREAER